VLKPIKLASFALIIISCLLTACGRESIKGEGEPKQEHREVQAFSGLEIDGDYTIIGKIGKPQEFVIASNPNILPHIKSSVDSDILTIKNDDNVNLQPTIAQHVWFTTEQFHTLRLNGNSRFQLTGLNSENLDCVFSGSQKVLLRGKAATLKVVSNGTSNIDARSLQVKDADIEINGSGIVSLMVSDHLKVNINGDGQVIYYNGKPKVDQTIHGAGQVKSAFGPLEQ
jgi:hypothetical protein